MLVFHPCPFPPTKATGAVARGLAYEKKLESYLSPFAAELGWTFYSHPWFYTTKGWISPDFIFETPTGLVILEAKLTYTDWASVQLDKYSRLLPDVQLTAQICKNLTPAAPTPITSFYDLYPGAVWHKYLS